MLQIKPFASAVFVAALATCFAANPLGPGSGPWDVEAPSAHGLSEEQLRQAWTELRDHKSLGRDCFVLIKDGALVYEGYAQGFNTTTSHQVN